MIVVSHNRKTLYGLVVLTLTFVCVIFVYDSSSSDGGVAISMATVLNRLKHVAYVRIDNTRLTSLAQSWLQVQDQGQGYAVLAREQVTSSRPGQVWVTYQATLPERLGLYNYVIGHVRNDVIRHITSATSSGHSPSSFPTKATTIFHDLKSYLRELGQRLSSTAMKTVYLQYLGPPLNVSIWDSRAEGVNQNLLVTDYYEWQGSDDLCSWLKDNHYDFLHTSPCIRHFGLPPTVTIADKASVFFKGTKAIFLI